MEKTPTAEKMVKSDLSRGDLFKTRTRLLTDTPLLSPEALTAMLMGLREMMAEPPSHRAVREIMKPEMKVERGVAIIPITGVMMHKPSAVEMYYFDAEDTGHMTKMVESATANADINGILLDIDSGGGMLTGVPELADAITRARQFKPVVAYTDGMMASAAYWAGCHAHLVISARSAYTGSIGVYISFTDFSKWFEELGVKVEVIKNKEGTYKGMGLPGTALTKEQREFLQSRVDKHFKWFSSEVQKRRGTLEADTMRGQTFIGSEAKKVGLVDYVGSRDFAKMKLRRIKSGS